MADNRYRTLDADFLFPSSRADGTLLVVLVLTDIVAPSAFCATPLLLLVGSELPLFWLANQIARKYYTTLICKRLGAEWRDV